MLFTIMCNNATMYLYKKKGVKEMGKLKKWAMDRNLIECAECEPEGYGEQ